MPNGYHYPHGYGRPSYSQSSSSQAYPSTSLYPTSYTNVMADNYNYTPGDTPMSRRTSNASGSSSSGHYSNSTPATSPGAAYDNPSPPRNPEYHDPRYSSQGIEVVHAGPVSRSGRQQSSRARQTSSTTTTTTNAHHQPPQFFCLHPGCEHISGRAFDLQRHMKKHNPVPEDEKYDCPGKGCGRQGRYGFDRKDHMTEHLRNYHCWEIPKGRNKERRI